MFAVGVGKNVDEKEISNISSDPDEDFTFHVESFLDLGNIAVHLAQKTCQALSLLGADISKKTQKCRKKPANVMIVYDSHKPAQTTQAVLSDLIGMFTFEANIHVPDTQVGVLTHECHAGGHTPIQPVADLQASLKELYPPWRAAVCTSWSKTSDLTFS
ncbi:collagen alpha-3(VI) chain [Elysia marginata]|uniref:Collagen alpha-3(VI) chain n=1 Tax=Elysia marginata TaxID=1093978 RepID=A0AAV4IIY2_9GAST|nr:collagen alpha-3(VI) chain [Elysia marginata]